MPFAIDLMSGTAIKVQGLGKKYRIGGPAERYRTFRDALTGFVKSPLRHLSGSPQQEIWAVKDVSFQIEQGETVGVIGRNGAGKSTLLKILSRITEPTEGRVMLCGRVGSLLEVGTGFHPELTGRENIFLNGAILGMTRAEMKTRFDEIVDFAEIEKFLETPVKHYSSGMYVRLAFAVAAHLEPEILLVDEVLAVGDASFQKKCLGRMGKVAKEGRAVLFVSHHMPAIQSFCTRALLFSGGCLVEDGATDAVVKKYVHANSGNSAGKTDLANYGERTSCTEIAIQEAWIEDDSHNVSNTFQMGSNLTIVYRFKASRSISAPGFGFGVDDSNGARLFSANNYFMAGQGIPDKCRSGTARCTFRSIPLQPGRYYVSVALVENERTIIDYVERMASFDIVPSDVFGSGKIPDSSQGMIFVPAKIEVEN